jgi:hypothetical protein
MNSYWYLHFTNVYLLKRNAHSYAYLYTTSFVKVLKPSGFFTYHRVSDSKILHGARFTMSALCGFENRQRLLLCTSLTDWLL